jgi:hypothetical protein
MCIVVHIEWLVASAVVGSGSASARHTPTVARDLGQKNDRCARGATRPRSSAAAQGSRLPKTSDCFVDEVHKALIGPQLGRSGRLPCFFAPRAECLIYLRICAARPPRTSRLLSCHRAVGYPAAPGLTVECATTSEIPRRRAKRLISPSPDHLGTNRLSVGAFLIPPLQLQDQASAVALQLDRRSAHRRMWVRLR